jgi:hypothetical protein
VTGIEPASSAWKAGVLPLNYTRLLCVLDTSYILTDGMPSLQLHLRTQYRTRTDNLLLVRQPLSQLS